MCWFVVHLVIKEWQMQTQYISYFTEIHFGCFFILLGHKSDTMFYPSNWVNSGSIQSMKRYLRRNTVLDVLLRFILFSCIILPVRETDTICKYALSNFLSWLRKLLVIENWLKQTRRIRYFTKIHLGSFMIWHVHKEETMCYLSNCVDCCKISYWKVI